MVDIIGYLRFSHPARSDVNIQKRLKSEELLDAIWTPDVMDLRLLCFERFVAPSIKAQTDQNFRVCLVSSPRMPKVYHERLADITRGIRQIIHVVEDVEPGEKVHDLFDRWYAANISNQAKTALHFRIDDDDPLSIRLIETMRATAEHMIPGDAFSAPNGLVAGVLDGQPHVLAFSKPFHSIGLGFLKEAQDTQISPYRGPSHSQLAWTMPARLAPLNPAWIYMLHQQSDSRWGQRKRLKTLLRQFSSFAESRRAERMFKTSFPHIDPEMLVETLNQIG